jgi:hypothetical protein
MPGAAYAMPLWEVPGVRDMRVLMLVWLWEMVTPYSWQIIGWEDIKLQRHNIIFAQSAEAWASLIVIGDDEESGCYVRDCRKLVWQFEDPSTFYHSEMAYMKLWSTNCTKLRLI